MTGKVQPLTIFDNYVNSSLCQDKEFCDYANNGIKELKNIENYFNDLDKIPLENSS